MRSKFAALFAFAALALASAPAHAQSTSVTPLGWLAGPDGSGPTPSGTVDQPKDSTHLTGWVVDTSAQGWSGIDDVQVWNGPMNLGGQQIGHATIQLDRPDVAAALGNPYWSASGFSVTLPANTLGSTSVYVYAHTPAKGWWYQQVLSTASVVLPAAGPRLEVEVPTPLATVNSNAPYVARGFAFDPTAQQGTGIDRVQLYLNGDRTSGIYIGDAALGSYDKYAAATNPQFANAGWQLTFQPNSWLPNITDDQFVKLTVYAHSSVTGAEQQSQTTIVVSIP
jgi:hypothetical protein